MDRCHGDKIGIYLNDYNNANSQSTVYIDGTLHLSAKENGASIIKICKPGIDSQFKNIESLLYDGVTVASTSMGNEDFWTLVSENSKFTLTDNSDAPFSGTILDITLVSKVTPPSTDDSNDPVVSPTDVAGDSNEDFTNTPATGDSKSIIGLFTVMVLSGMATVIIIKGKRRQCLI